jgi:hypothetical protein
LQLSALELVPTVLPVLFEAHFVTVKLKPAAGAGLHRPGLSALRARTALPIHHNRAASDILNYCHFTLSILRNGFSSILLCGTGSGSRRGAGTISRRSGIQEVDAEQGISSIVR